MTTQRPRSHPRFVRGTSRYKPEGRLPSAVKAEVHHVLSRSPSLRRLIVPLYRRAQHERGRLARILAGVPRDPLLDVDRVLWVAPADIRYKTLAPGSAFRNLGCGWVLDGDWDVFEHPFVNDARYKAVRDVIINGLPWAETEEYACAVASITDGVPVQRCRTTDELDAHCAALDRVIESLQKDGYLTQEEIRRRGLAAGLGRDDEITVAIGRGGDLMYRDGAHRLAMAQLLGLERIPVRVTIRHPEWMEVRRHVAGCARRGRGFVPQPILHPDLDNVPAVQRCEERWRTLERAIPPEATLVDLTPGWGHFCRRLSETGRQCTAVALPPSERVILERLGRAGRDYPVMSPEPGEMTAGGLYDFGLLLDDGLPGPRHAALPGLLRIVARLHPQHLLVEPAAFTSDGAGRAGGDSAFASVLSALREAGGYTAAETLLGDSEAGPLVHLA